MTCVNSLPPELIDTSIDFLHADAQSLYACSLVCPDWLPATRFHLFGFVKVYQSLKAAGSRRHCRHPANTLPFIELLESRDNTIAPYIRGAMLDMTGVDIPNRLIGALCNAQVNITKLITTTYRQNLAFLSRLSQVFPGITTLEVRVSPALFHATEDYARIYEGFLFAMSFPSLQTLCFDAAFESEVDVPPSIRPKLSAPLYIAFQHLRTLTLHVQDSETIIRWLRNSGWTPRLHKLSVHVYHPQDGRCGPMPHLNALVDDTCDTLKGFSVIVDGSNEGGVLPNITNQESIAEII